MICCSKQCKHHLSNGMDMGSRPVNYQDSLEVYDNATPQPCPVHCIRRPLSGRLFPEYMPESNSQHYHLTEKSLYPHQHLSGSSGDHLHRENKYCGESESSGFHVLYRNPNFRIDSSSEDDGLYSIHSVKFRAFGDILPCKNEHVDRTEASGEHEKFNIFNHYADLMLYKNANFSQCCSESDDPRSCEKALSPKTLKHIDASLLYKNDQFITDSDSKGDSKISSRPSKISVSTMSSLELLKLVRSQIKMQNEIAKKISELCLLSERVILCRNVDQVESLAMPSLGVSSGCKARRELHEVCNNKDSKFTPWREIYKTEFPSPKQHNCKVTTGTALLEKPKTASKLHNSKATTATNCQILHETVAPIPKTHKTEQDDPKIQGSEVSDKCTVNSAETFHKKVLPWAVKAQEMFAQTRLLELKIMHNVNDWPSKMQELFESSIKQAQQMKK